MLNWDEFTIVQEWWPPFCAAVLEASAAIIKLCTIGVPVQRSSAIRSLADKWPDETTRTFLTQRAVDDEHENTRSAALRVLADKWPDETRGLFSQRVLQDPDKRQRGAAWTGLGKLHSEFGRVLPTRDLDGVGPYLDPLEPVSQDHIESTAKKVGIRSEDIDAQVAALSDYFGWDITVGAKAAIDGSTPAAQATP